ncbi:transcriptional regulator [Altererythrobacter salegens]|uniref:Transcriptional regulator n=1 Tax=Croceibacterium salegens TaxID=1737568 RepID=A0A6I4SS09_9SPHN|nr:transcriptional regulator [Croceibacterium salegens]MXO58663.1 transcriptional regulator [Croceibacterium salegens]
MSEPGYAFAEFRLDPADRRLTREGETVEINARYLDALLLMLATPGRLVSKDRFHDEVWRGIPVTDEALTQCIRTLRRALGDDATAPRFIETVPRHGYRFIAEVEQAGFATEAAVLRPAPSTWTEPFAAALGGAAAGVFGATAYGATGLVAPGIGTASTLVVLASLAFLLGLAGGGAVGLGIAIGRRKGSAWSIAGGALGGLLVGGVAHMVGTDLFDLLFGAAPRAMTGAAEGFALGGATGIGAWLARRADDRPLWRCTLPGFAAGGLAGLAIALAGGRLLAGSLAALAASFPGSRLVLHGLGPLPGAQGFGPTGLVLVTGIEGALFAGSVAGALALVRRLHRQG